MIVKKKCLLKKKFVKKNVCFHANAHIYEEMSKETGKVPAVPKTSLLRATIALLTSYLTPSPLVKYIFPIRFRAARLVDMRRRRRSSEQRRFRQRRFRRSSRIPASSDVNHFRFSRICVSFDVRSSQRLSASEKTHKPRNRG